MLHTISIVAPLLGYQTNCFFRINSITHGLHTYWKDSGQDNSWVMCIRRLPCQHFFRQFPSGCLSNKAKSQLHAQSRILMCKFRVEILLWVWPRKHTVTPQSHCAHWLWPSLGPSGCLAFSDTAFPLFWLRLLHLSQTAPPPVERKGEEK